MQVQAAQYDLFLNPGEPFVMQLAFHRREMEFEVYGFNVKASE